MTARPDVPDTPDRIAAEKRATEDAVLAERVRCPYCAAPEGEPCRTATGGPVRSSHSWRWADLRRHMRTRRFVVRVLEDDVRLGVKAGEEYIAETYRLDPGKVTLLSRVPDGYDPQCNQYGHTIEWVGWAS